MARLLYSLFTLHAAITDDYAKLASGWWSTFTRRDSDPLGFNEEFLTLHISIIHMPVSPLPGLILAQSTSNFFFVANNFFVSFVAKSFMIVLMNGFTPRGRGVIASKSSGILEKRSEILVSRCDFGVRRGVIL